MIAAASNIFHVTKQIFADVFFLLYWPCPDYIAEHCPIRLTQTFDTNASGSPEIEMTVGLVAKVKAWSKTVGARYLIFVRVASPVG